MRRDRRLFLALSAVLLGTALTSIGISHRLASHALADSLEQRGQTLRAAVTIALSASEAHMLQMAALLARDPQVQERFQAGARAVEQEGGGAGGAAAALARAELLAATAPRWREMQAEYRVRQLHFHVGAEVTSFLRVHQPDRFGDPLGELRPLLAAAAGRREARSGFEVGRIYSGLRGVVPVFAPGDRAEGAAYVGLVEVGTSFDGLVQLLDQRLGAGVAVLLHAPLVQETMWAEFVSRYNPQTLPICNCSVEATSRDEYQAILSAHREQTAIDLPHTHRLPLAGKEFAVTHFPLLDFAGRSVGGFMLWYDISSEVAGLRRQLWDQVVVAGGGLLALELLLWATIRFGTRHLEREVSLRTAEIQHLNRRLERLAITDELTGLFNRRYFEEALEREIARAARERSPLALLLLDLDHFKQVNDTRGHLAGDAALREVADLLLDLCRPYDVVGRFGGEELVVLLPLTDLAEACRVAERLREAVAGHTIHDPHRGEFTVTTSIGVALWRPGEGMTELLDRADAALYAAKEAGRNRVMPAGAAAQRCASPAA